MLRILVFVFATTVFGIVHSGGLIELSESAYKEHQANSALLIVQINWGRKWGCGEYENAQIHKLSFNQSSTNGQFDSNNSIIFETPSRLFVKDEFVPYAYIVEPGQYALVEYDIKVARSTADVGHLLAKKGDLFKNGNAVGGTFTATKGKATYIGHFGLDCYQQPIPWRYHINGRVEFEKYVEGFRKRFPFVRNVPVSFKLFSTSILGQPYSLGEGSSDVQ